MRLNHVLMVLTSVAFACATGNLRCSEEQFNGLGGSLPSPRSPSEYSRCVQGAVHTVPCPNGQYFDAHMKKCLFEPAAREVRSETTFQFEELCNNPNAVEIFPNPTNCSQYIICYGLVPIEQSCANGLLFNPQLNTCDIPTNVVCGYNCPAIDDPSNPVWLPDSRLEDCSRHYLCFQGNPLQFYCYNNLYFDIVSRTCTYPQYSACSVPGVYCNANMTMNVANPRSCTSYYVCEDGFPHFRNCDFEEYFSEALGMCIPGTCEPGTTTTSGTTTFEPSSTTASSETTTPLTSTTDLNTPTGELTSTTPSLTTTELTPTTDSTTVDLTTTSTPLSTQDLSTTTTSFETTTTIESTTLTSEPESTTLDSSTPEPTTSGELSTTEVLSTTTASPSTPETTSEFITDSTSSEPSTASSTQEISTTTTEASTSELTETTTVELTTTSTDSTTTMPETTTTTEMVTIDPNEVCAGLGIVILPYPGSCILYILCLNGIGGVSTCAAGQIFNPDTTTCVPGNQETCTFT
ncbi:mucin-2-like [Anopheles marshallii]|uniref:mucin-2-like n=1 Tax=Anopheles marshallii TaxID=1521116 RepID=UPI00237ADCDE|nr:mucin-2-like [Anopheles marshallii]